jgi:hypothetical protein
MHAPDMTFENATATHCNTMRRGDLVAGPTGRTVRWRGVDVIPFENGLVEAQGRVLGLGVDPVSGRTARLGVVG